MSGPIKLVGASGDREDDIRASAVASVLELTKSRVTAGGGSGLKDYMSQLAGRSGKVGEAIYSIIER